MTVDDGVSNPTSSRPFEEIARARLSRRGIIGGGLAAAAAGFIGTGGLSGTAAAANASAPAVFNDPLVGFDPIPLYGGTGVSISSDYDYSVILPWGDPVRPGGPGFSWPPTSAAQENQIGIGHDGMWFFAINNNHGVLCVNHEFGTNPHVLGKDFPESLEDVRVSQAAHGIGCYEIKRVGDTWVTVNSNKTRRVTANTPVTFSGPVAGSPLLDTPAGNAAAGTVNNCANGYTPWGTYLTCEENFNGYFGSSEGEGFSPSEAQSRYGLSADGFGYGWHVFDPRWDLSNPAYTNESNRFGWIVEVNPFDGSAVPVKRTALGRFKHEGAAVKVTGNGHVVVYMGDDERFDYVYKFVSSGPWPEMVANGQSPLDSGTLYCARFNEDGTGDWLPLTLSNPAVAARFSSMDDVLVHARLAADAAGATPMDRPEWGTIGADGCVYMTMTNNSRREVADAANPQAPNPDGHIIKWMDAGGGTGTTFLWDIWILASDTHGTDCAFGSPDGLWADPDGRLIIETDGGQPDDGNNQLLVGNASTGVIKRLLAGPKDCEITGFAVTPDRRTAFCNVQHPGDGDPATTTWPTGSAVPRDATIVFWRRDGGIIGS
ncbi:MAG: PhoX family phosphatase [Acidimicrobiales bacterium]